MNNQSFESDMSYGSSTITDSSFSEVQDKSDVPVSGEHIDETTLMTYNKQRLVDLFMITQDELIKTRNELHKTREELSDHKNRFYVVHQQLAETKTLLDIAQKVSTGLGGTPFNYANNGIIASDVNDVYSVDENVEKNYIKCATYKIDNGPLNGQEKTESKVREDGFNDHRLSQGKESTMQDEVKGNLEIVDTPPDATDKQKSPLVLPSIQVYECKSCPLTFSQFTRYKRHLQTHRIPNQKKNSANDNDKTQATSENPVESHGCKVCHEEFPLESSMHEHAAKAHSDWKAFRCMMCDSSFTVQSRLALHSRRHANRRRRKCDECSKRFRTSAQLQKHVNASHPRGQHSYKCDVCGELLISRYHLDSHNAQLHPGYLDKRLTHDVGGKSVSPSKGFKSPRVQYNGVGEREFTCETCGKGFQRKATLAQHRFVHSGEKTYACEECGKSFNNAGKLKRHSRVHTGDRPYICGECGKKFTQCGDLKRHTRTHSAENHAEIKNDKNAIMMTTNDFGMQDAVQYDAINHHAQVEPRSDFPMPADPSHCFPSTQQHHQQQQHQPDICIPRILANPPLNALNVQPVRILHRMDPNDREIRPIANMESRNPDPPLTLPLTLPLTPPLTLPRPMLLPNNRANNPQQMSADGSLRRNVMHTDTAYIPPNNFIPISEPLLRRTIPPQLITHPDHMQMLNDDRSYQQQIHHNLPAPNPVPDTISTPHLNQTFQPQPYLSNYDLNMHRVTTTPNNETPFGAGNFPDLLSVESPHTMSQEHTNCYGDFDYKQQYLNMPNRFNINYTYPQYNNNHPSPNRDISSTQWFPLGGF